MKKKLISMMICTVLSVAMLGTTAMASEVKKDKKAMKETAESALETYASESLVGTLKEGVSNTVTKPGYYAFTPSVSGYYEVNDDCYYDEDGDDDWYDGHYAFEGLDDSYNDSCYLEAGKRYRLHLSGETFHKGTVELSRVTNTITAGTFSGPFYNDNDIFAILTVGASDTFSFTSDVNGDLDIYVYGYNGEMPYSGYNDYDLNNDLCNFSKTMSLTPGNYLVHVKSYSNPATGTYTISHTNHTLGAATADTATVFQGGTSTRTCSVCGYSETTATPKLTPTIKLSATKKKIKKGKSYNLTIANLANGDSVKSVKVNKKKIVTIKKKGANQYKIIAKKKGKVTVTVKLASGMTAKCKITVK